MHCRPACSGPGRCPATRCCRPAPQSASCSAFASLRRGKRGAQEWAVSYGRPELMGAHTRCGSSARTRPIGGHCWSPESRSVALASLTSCFHLCGGRREPKESQPAVPPPVSQSQGRKVATWTRCAASTATGKQRKNKNQNKTGSCCLHGNHVDISRTFI